MERLLLYHDFVSPFSRLAVVLAAEAASRTGMTVRPVPLELHPSPTPLPAPGAFAEELEAARAFAGEHGLRLGALERVPRTRKAHETVAYAGTEGPVLPVLTGIYDALWDRDLDIGRLDVLADLGEAAGLDREALHVALGVDEHEAEVVREQEAAAAAGLTGVPAFQVRDVVAVGLLPVDELVEWVEANR